MKLFDLSRKNHHLLLTHFSSLSWTKKKWKWRDILSPFAVRKKQRSQTVKQFCLPAGGLCIVCECSWWLCCSCASVIRKSAGLSSKQCYSVMQALMCVPVVAASQWLCGFLFWTVFSTGLFSGRRQGGHGPACHETWKSMIQWHSRDSNRVISKLCMLPAKPKNTLISDLRIQISCCC